jgi:fumarate hydratase class II
MGQYIDADVPEGEPKPSRWVHYGMTSSDLGDTALCYQLTQATDIIIEDCRRLGEICKRRAFEERETLCVGRTHGIHADPMTFGMKFGSWAWEFYRDLARLRDARRQVAVGAISGAVGTYSSIDPFIESYVCEHMGLDSDPLSTQVISRDHHAYLASVLATTAASCERIAQEVRAYQKTDTLEAEEPFRKGQKGSSAMPHKRNPITVEKVCGLARCVKANAQVAYDNVAGRVALFAATVDTAMETDLRSDAYERMLSQTLADRLAEATAEVLHREVRCSLWGYAPQERLDTDALLRGDYQGIRPAVGYPSLPDQSIIFIIDKLLNLKDAGISLTPNGAMRPHASVCGLMIAHPAAQYFSIGKIDRDIKRNNK